MRILLSLPGVHRVHRGAEVALESIAAGLADRGHDVTMFGSGDPRPDAPYRYRRLPLVERGRFERWPAIPPVRDESVYEALTYLPGLLAAYRPGEYDVTMTCGFPVDNIALRRPRLRGPRPKHVFVTENGDWPALDLGRDARLFSCDGLVCTNPVFLERNERRWDCSLIPNGIDVDRFSPGAEARSRLGLPIDVPLVLMVSALIPSKRVETGIEAVARLTNASDDSDAPLPVLLVAGDGPERSRITELGRKLLGDRFVLRSFDFDDMADLYRSADVLYHPTLLESFGNVYIESLACGLPVVAHRSAVTEWIAGADAELIDTEQPDLVVQALRRSLGAGRVDATVAERIRSTFSWGSVALAYEEFLAQVTAR